MQLPAQINHLKRSTTPAARTRKLATWWLPLTLSLGFALLFTLLFRDRLLPARDVRVVAAAAIVAEASATAAPSGNSDESRLLFQASGWLEPDPFPVRATALAAGVVSEVHVLEGDLVELGQALATLIDEDARLARDAMAADLAMKEAEFDAHCTEVQTMLQKLAAEQAIRKQALATAEEAHDRHERYTRGGIDATTESERVSARFEKTRSRAAVDIVDARIREIAWDFNRIAYETLAHRHGLDMARTMLAEAELNLQRTQITAPIRGRVMRLFAVPGDKKMLAMEDMDSATIAKLYDPEKLQVRVDVPLADAADLTVGQRARIRCGLLPDAVFDGEVTRIAGEADIQRNTLQAKVRVIAPDDRLRPEMICRVEFYQAVTQSSGTTAQSATAGDLAVFIPESALIGGEQVWICDVDSSRLEAREVVATRELRDGWLRIESGIRPGEWVVDDPASATLKSGQRVRPNLQP